MPWGGDSQFHFLEQPGVALASVRFGAHYGLNSDIAPSPKTFTLAEVSERALQATFFDHKNARKLGVKPQPEVGKSGMSYAKI